MATERVRSFFRFGISIVLQLAAADNVVDRLVDSLNMHVYMLSHCDTNTFTFTEQPREPASFTAPISLPAYLLEPSSDGDGALQRTYLCVTPIFSDRCVYFGQGR